MKLAFELYIDAPIDLVAKIGSDPLNSLKWEKALSDCKHISGEPLQPGATYSFLLVRGKRKIPAELKIIQRDFPHVFVTEGTTQGIKEFITTTLTEDTDGRVKVSTRHELTFSNVIMRWVMWPFLPMIKANVNKTLAEFKAYVEQEAKALQHL